MPSCTLCIKDENDGTCQDEPFITREEDSVDEKTLQVDVFGEIKFQGSTTKKAKYIKIDRTFDEIENARRYLLSQKGFSLPKPKLILSVTGGAKKFTIDEPTKVAFKLGLMKVARSTNAMIISGGTDDGVMKLVGDAVDEDLFGNEVPVLGIAVWGCVSFKDKPGRKTQVNANHSCFIFVDSGEAKFGGEIDFRTKLEKQIKTRENIPLVLIVLEGGRGTLQTILGALETNSPVLLVSGTRGCTDLVIEAKQAYDRAGNIDDVNAVLSQNQFRRLIEDEARRPQLLNDLISVLSHRNYNCCINVFQMRRGDAETDIEPMILNALSKAEENAFHRMDLAIRWNRFDIAKREMQELVILKEIPVQNRNEERINPSKILLETQLHQLFQQAILLNRPDFVELILKYNLDISAFLTKRRLADIYNDQTVSRRKEPLQIYLETHNFINQYNTQITVEGIKYFFKRRFDTFNPFFLPDDFNVNETAEPTYVGDPEINLFFYCILTNRVEVAKTFWKIGRDQICFALMASKILNYFGYIFPDDKPEYEASAKEFESLAIGILNVFDKNQRDVVNDVLVVRYLRFIQMDCLQLAVDCGCQEFVSHRLAQKTLEAIWAGNQDDNTANLSANERRMKECQMQYNHDRNYIFNNKNIKRLNENSTTFDRIIKFFFIPRTKYMLNLAFYALFLLFFTYTMLFEKKTDENDNESKQIDDENTTSIEQSNSTFTSSAFKNFKRKFPVRETLLFLWVCFFFFEEIRQAFFSSFSKGTKISKMKKYFASQWNRLDVIGCVLFLFGYILTCIAISGNKGAYTWARITLSIDLGLWYIRALQLGLISPFIGPKLFMIRRMVNDLSYFLIIIATFLLAYGVSAQAIIEPYSEHSFNVIFDILDKAYWPIFGELKVLETISNDTCKEHPNDPACLSPSNYAVSYLLLMIYMIGASVLLINLLIAMFSNTFEEIQIKSDIVWKNQRYEIISEYVDSPLLPPPLNLIAYIKYLVDKFKDLCDQDENNGNQSDNVLIEFEQKCTEELMRNRNNDKLKNLESRLEKIEKQLHQLSLNKYY